MIEKSIVKVKNDDIVSSPVTAVGLVSTLDRIDWTSCKSISKNLLIAYRSACRNSLIYSIGRWQKPSDMTLVARRILRDRPGQLVFIDHTPMPDALLLALQRLDPSYNPQINIHVYGDFIRNLREWKAIEPLLVGRRIRFLCASTRQTRLLKNLIAQPRAVCRVPFPVDTQVFRPRSLVRRDWRERLGVQNDDFLITYTGRFSLQKNLFLLGQGFERAAALDSRFHLALAVQFDDLGAPLFGLHQRKGQMRREWLSFFRGIPRSIRERIHLMEDLSSHDLVGLYNATDLFCSLSTYHDEDFGMSPAEAMACGTPCALANWGGFWDFKKQNPDHCQLFPVEIRQGRFLPRSPFWRHFQGLAKLRRSRRDRALCSRRLRAHFSIESVAQELGEQLKMKYPVFSGFSKEFKPLHRALDKKAPFPRGASRQGLYGQIYRAYFD